MSEQQIPAPLLDNLQKAAEYDATAAAAGRSITYLDSQIATVKAELERLRTEHAEYGREQTTARYHADMHRAMVTEVCKVNGWPVPELPPAAELQITPEDPLNLERTSALPLPPKDGAR